MNAESILNKLSWIDNIAGGVWLLLTIIVISMVTTIINQIGWANKFVYILVALIVVAWLHPLYTNMFPSLWTIQIGNIVTLVFTVTILYQLGQFSRPMSYWLLPQTIWTIAAIIYTSFKFFVYQKIQ